MPGPARNLALSATTTWWQHTLDSRAAGALNIFSPWRAQLSPLFASPHPPPPWQGSHVKFQEEGGLRGHRGQLPEALERGGEWAASFASSPAGPEPSSPWPLPLPEVMGAEDASSARTLSPKPPASGWQVPVCGAKTHKDCDPPHRRLGGRRVGARGCGEGPGLGELASPWWAPDSSSSSGPCPSFPLKLDQACCLWGPGPHLEPAPNTPAPSPGLI